MEEQIGQEASEGAMSISIDVSEATVLGVFKKKVHLKAQLYIESEDELQECIIVIKQSTFHKLWETWLKGKRDVCESYLEYCGEMGYISAVEWKTLGDTTLLEWSDDLEDMVEVSYPMFKVTAFENYADFEHG